MRDELPRTIEQCAVEFDHGRRATLIRKTHLDTQIVELKMPVLPPRRAFGGQLSESTYTFDADYAIALGRALLEQGELAKAGVVG